MEVAIPEGLPPLAAADTAVLLGLDDGDGGLGPGAGGEDEMHISPADGRHPAEDEDDDDDDDDEDDGRAAMMKRLAALTMAPSGQGAAPGLGAMSNGSQSHLSMMPTGPGAGVVGPLSPGAERDRNRHLIGQLLSLDQPFLTRTMMDFLVRDGVCKLLVSFITQVPEEGEDGQPGGPGAAELRAHPLPRPQKGDALDHKTQDALEKSFRAVMLLAGEPTEELSGFLDSKAGEITEAIFEVFQPYARGSFHHACRVIDQLLRCYADSVFLVVGSNAKSVKRYLGRMVKCLEFPPVAETLVKMVCLPSMNGQGHYKITPINKWKTFESLAEWRLLLVLAEEIFDRHPPAASPEHVTAAADVLIELLERLCTDENGELLLQPLGHTYELVNGLMECALDASAPRSQRCDCARVLVAAARRSGEQHVPISGMMYGQGFGMGNAAMCVNQFKGVRPLYINRLNGHFTALCDAIVAEGSPPGAGSHHEVCHPGYTVAVPFSYLRLQLVTLLVELVAADHKRLGKLPLPLWRLLTQWFFQYPFGNLYHGVYYRLVFQTLRHGDEATQQVVLSKCKLVSTLVDAYTKGEPCWGNRGYVLQLCNAIRLQAGTLPPSAWLRTFLKSHDSWRKFLGQLREATEREQQVGLGIVVPSAKRLGGMMMQQELGFGLGVGGDPPPPPAPPSPPAIDYGSAYARSLGFGESVEYVVEESNDGKGKKKKKKKKKKKGTAGAEDKDDDEDDDDSASAADSCSEVSDADAEEADGRSGPVSSASASSSGAPTRLLEPENLD
jgi:hypothetical protein